jgi:hypothetical protein
MGETNRSYKEWITNQTDFNFKESLNEKEQDLVIVEAFALPWGKVSRNGILYNRDSFKSNLDKWNGIKVMYNHLVEGNDYPKGKVLKAWDTDEGMYVRLGLDPKEEGLIHKLKLGLLDQVSLHILPSKTIARENYTEALFGSCVEMSIVPSPGFMETNMKILAEKYMDSFNEVEIMEENNTPTTSEGFKELSEKFTTLQKEYSEKVGTFEEKLKENTEVLENQKKVFSEALDALEDIGDDSEDINDVKSDVSDVVSALSAINDRISVLSEEMAELSTKIDELKELEKEEHDDEDDNDDADQEDENESDDVNQEDENEDTDDMDVEEESVSKSTLLEKITKKSSVRPKFGLSRL